MTVIGEWWNRDIVSVQQQALFSGAAPNISDALTINGQPGDLLKCSQQGLLVYVTLSIEHKQLVLSAKQRPCVKR